ncbi:MAG: adenosine deaminase [Chloroflexota bacterium]|nr:adenosine deaminase [Chloroflexota bacterium]
MPSSSFITQMPKVELHVHLEGAVRPETLLKLAQKNRISLPANTVDGLQNWYSFVNFPHFVDIYVKISECIQKPDDLELVTREFMEGQAAQNILYTEATYTAYTHLHQKGLSFADQLAAINRARAWGESALGVQMNLIVDIAREVSPEEGLLTADMVIESYGNGVVALGLGGYEVGHPPEKHAASFAKVQAAGVPCVLHAGETAGPESIWGALRAGYSQRIGHGVRCLEDEALVAHLREKQIPLEVCPTSNVCLGVVPSLADHPIQKLLDAGLYVTVNSDDPPMFNTTLTQEFETCTKTFGWDVQLLERLTMNAARAALLPNDQNAALQGRITDGFASLRAQMA